jgi:hypothetical protein
MTDPLPRPTYPENYSETCPGSHRRTYPETYVETYFADGRWHSRRHDSDLPFATGSDELEQIALGSQVARWNRVPHIIRAADGAVAETIPPR